MRTLIHTPRRDPRTRLPLLVLAALLAGGVAGVWDLMAADLRGTLALLLLAGGLIGAAAPRGAAPLAVMVALGVLLANLTGPVPPGVRMPELERGLISAAVSLLPTGLGAVMGALAAGTASRLGWR